MAYFLGIDSGGTKTECWLGDETRVLARAQTRTIKLTRVSREVASTRLRTLLHEVSSKSGIPLESVTRTCVGVAGFSIQEVRDWAEHTVGELVGGEVEVCGDDEIALDSAFFGGAGILVIGGTGSAVLGRCADGVRFKAGGWGPGIGDEGSGFWIGRESLRRAFAAMDTGEPCTLLEAIRQAWQADDLGQMVALANTAPGPDYSALTPVVMRCAAEGDTIALKLLQDAGEQLARQVAVVWEKMMAHGESSCVVAYTGSVLEKIDATRASLKSSIMAQCPGLKLVDHAVSAMDGALWRARRGVVLPGPEMARQAMK